MLCPEDRKTDTPAYCSPTSDTCAAGTTCFPVAGVCCKNVAPVVVSITNVQLNLTPSYYSNHPSTRSSMNNSYICILKCIPCVESNKYCSSPLLNTSFHTFTLITISWQLVEVRMVIKWKEGEVIRIVSYRWHIIPDTFRRLHRDCIQDRVEQWRMKPIKPPPSISPATKPIPNHALFFSLRPYSRHYHSIQCNR